MKKFIRAVSCFSVAAACLLAGGCGGGNSPDGVVSRYLEAMEDRNIETVLKLVNLDGEKDPNRKVTELAFIRGWIMDEVYYYEYFEKEEKGYARNPFRAVKQLADDLSKIVVEEETDSTAKVLCFKKNGGEEVFYVDKVDGVWKIRYEHDNNYLVTSGAGYDSQSPFCKNLGVDSSYVK